MTQNNKAELLKQQCRQAINHPVSGGKIRLVIPGKWGNSNRKQFVRGKGAPFGEIISDYNDKSVLVVFDAQELLTYLEAISDAN